MSGLREREAPKARVLAYIKDPSYGPGKRVFVELTGFRNVNTNLSRSVNGTASVAFPNYKSCLLRYLSSDDITGVETASTGGATTNTFALSYMQRLTGMDNLGATFKGLWNDVVLSEGMDSMVHPVASANFKNYGRSRGDVMDGKDKNTMYQVWKSKLMASLISLDLFDPIFVDFLGQDGFWYAGFTGLTTQIAENYNKTGDQSVTINCRDLSCLLDNVSVVSGWNRLSTAEQNSNLRNFVYSTEANTDSAKYAPFANIFDSFTSVQSIIEAVISRAQDMWRLDDRNQAIFKNVGVSAFKFDTQAKNADGTAAYPYYGISGRRGSVQRSDSEEPYALKPEDFLKEKDDDLTIKHYMCVPDNDLCRGTCIRGTKKIFVDPLLMKFDQIFIHKVLNNSLALYKDSLKSADQILNDIVAKMMAYKYFDANGNLIIELARPNAFPNLDKYGGRSSSTMILHELAKTADDKAKAKPSTGLKEPKTAPVLKGQTKAKFAAANNITVDDLIKLNGGLTNTSIFILRPGKSVDSTKPSDYVLNYPCSPIVGAADTTGAMTELKSMNVQPLVTYILKAEKQGKQNLDDDNRLLWTTLQYHGKNYVLSPDDFQSFSSSLNEAALVTVVVSDSMFEYITVATDVVNSSQAMHAVAVADYDKLAKLGVRRTQVQTLFNVTWPSRETGSKVLSYQAAAILERINALADTGTMTLNQRPDLQLGRTIINPIRMKSYIVEGITNSWTPGGSHLTTLKLEYGHPMHKTLEVPWLSLFTEPDLFFGPDGINVLEKIQAKDANGMNKTVQGNSSENYSGGGTNAA